MSTDLIKAQIMFKLLRKNNWGNSYDRLEHFKKFSNLKELIKDLSKEHLIIIHKKARFTGISLNNKYKAQIIKFIEKHLSELKGTGWID